MWVIFVWNPSPEAIKSHTEIKHVPLNCILALLNNQCLLAASPDEKLVFVLKAKRKAFLKLDTVLLNFQMRPDPALKENVCGKHNNGSVWKVWESTTTIESPTSRLQIISIISHKDSLQIYYFSHLEEISIIWGKRGFKDRVIIGQRCSKFHNIHIFIMPQYIFNEKTSPLQQHLVSFWHKQWGYIW